jgi:hypothetical protein
MSSIIFDGVLAALILAGAVLFSVYMAGYAVLFNARASYNVYDGTVASHARWLLPARATYESVTATPSAQQALDDRLKQLNFTAPVASGYPGRWLLPADDKELDELAAVLAST